MHTHALTRQAVIAALTFGGFFLLGYGGIFIWGGNSHSSSPIWPATAFGFVMLIRLSRSRTDDAAMLSAMLAAGLFANRLGGASPLLALGFSLINVLDVLAGLVAFRRLRLSRINSTGSMAKFAFLAGVSPSLLGGLLAAGLVARLGGDPVFTGTQWFLANLLGACILYPFGLTVSLRQFAKLRLERRLLEALGLFAMLAATSVMAF
ncbi:MAG TPA: MASE1 domain-containing protein, partial [Rhizomicrobium sp.]|nr:MASE1 domain-containing protein [Rhizomicrobium sp.]